MPDDPAALAGALSRGGRRPPGDVRSRTDDSAPLSPRVPDGEEAVKLPRRALVVGLARSGQAAALALARRGVPTVGVDQAAELDTGRLAEAGVEVHLGTQEADVLEGVDLVIKSPGVPGESPLPAAAHARGVPVWSEVELGFRLLRSPLIGVTGTNGKT